MSGHRSFDVAVAPEGALKRIAAAINRPKKRAFGIFKTANEYVGFVREDSFEIWERHQRAVHARGEVRPRRGGSTITVRAAIRPETRVLLVVFFVLYAIGVLTIATSGSDPGVSATELAVGIAGAAVLSLTFFAAARKQRSDLYALVERTFSDVPRI
jgi:hypothetical protein